MAIGWAVSACAPAADIAEGSIVSTSLCADSYLMALPDIHGQIGALSWQSRSALSTAPPELARLPQMDDSHERLASLGDVRVVNGPGTEGGGHTLAWGEDFETIWANLSELSTHLEANSPVPDLKARLGNLPESNRTPNVIYLNRAGGTAGPGTFVDAAIRASGARNLMTSPGWSSPDVEALIKYSPDAIIISFMDSDYAGVNDRAVRQSALSDWMARYPQVEIPGKLWPCAGPGLVEATEKLAAAWQEL